MVVNLCVKHVICNKVSARSSNEDAEEGSQRRGRGRGNHALRTYSPQQWKLVRREVRGASRQNTSSDVVRGINKLINYRINI